MGENVQELSGETFETDVLQSSEPVLVDFWAPWCGPCRKLAPVIDELATEYQGSVKVAKLNIDPVENQPIAAKYGIHSIPTVILFKDGQPVQTLQGLQPKAQFKAALDSVKG